MKPNLLDLDAAQLVSFFANIGEKPFRAKQLLRWMHQFGEADFSKMSDLAKPPWMSAPSACISPTMRPS